MPVFVEKDDEPEFVEKYDVGYYPSFVWTDATGKEVLRTVQPVDSEELLEEVESAVEELTAPADE